MEERLDKRLAKLEELSRSKAQDLIEKGQVMINGVKVNKTSMIVSEEDKIIVNKSEHDHYVGRGAIKLLHALKEFNVEVKDKIAMDVGASTGGFSQVLIESHAIKVYAIDVGQDQLAPSLLANPKIINMEKTNIKNLENLPDLVDLAVVDLSFISVRKVIGHISKLMKESGDIIILFKPQFEVGKKFLNKNHIVKDEQISKKCFEEFIDTIQKEGFIVKRKIPSPIKGREGNQEYLIHLLNKR